MTTSTEPTAAPALEEWFRTRTSRAADFADLEALARRKRELGVTVSVVLPCREVADTIGHIGDELGRVNARAPLIDQALAIDSGSADGTAAIAAAHGLEVRQEEELLPDLGPVLGKGDAMWRSLSAAHGDLILFADSDTANFTGHFVTGLLGPLLSDPAVRFVKGSFHRSAGRVTELTARPLFEAFYPELAVFGQPLAGEVAGSRELLRSIPFCTGYAVETAMMVDVLRTVGLAAMAQVHLGTRDNPHQPLSALGRMSREVVQALVARLEREGRLAPGERGGELHAVCSSDAIDLIRDRVEVVERPPMTELLAD
jgi:glucosyl-3-phosphoglycerate synthase